jgi:glycosyltransferase involved in cell wall biosynthesis
VSLTQDENASVSHENTNLQNTYGQKHTILLVAPWSLDIAGGVSEVLRNLIAQAQQSTDMAILLLLNDWDARRPLHSAHDGVDKVSVRWVSPWSSVRPIWNLVTLPVRLPTSIWRLYRLIQARTPAAVNVHFPDITALTLLWAYRLAVPAGSFVISFHGSDVTELEAAPLIARLWWRLLLSSVDRITCCSEDLRRRLVAVVGTGYEVSVIHNGIDPDRLDLEAKSGSVPPRLRDSTYLVSVAKFERKKGLDVLLQAFAVIRKERPEIKLALVGGLGGELQALRGLAQDLKLVDSVEFIVDADHPDAVAIIRGAELLALSSRQEPFGIVLLEAGYFSIPIVATRVGGIPEIIAPDVTGLLVPADDPRALADAMLSLLADPSRRRALAQNAKHRVLSQFTWRSAFAKYRATYLARSL